MSINDLTEMISPAFTEETVFEILRKKKALTKLKILEIVIDSEAAKKGDSYLSTIYRFVVKARGINTEGESEEISVPVVVKVFPKNVARQKTFRSVDFFKTEIYFYEQVWPEMKKIKSIRIPGDPDEIPFLLACYCDGKNDFVALEDLSFQGYKSFGRNDEVTMERLSLCLRTLANFHALGIVTREENPQFENIASQIAESYFAEKYRPWYGNFLNNSMGPRYQRAVKELLPQEYYDKFTELLSKDFYGKVVRCASIRDKLCSVTEGDSWLPNFMVNFEATAKPATILIDFQLARYAPVTNDLLQFLYACAACVPDQLPLKHWDDLVAEYHRYLSTRIEELGGGKNYITLKEINDEIQRHPHLGMLIGMESTVMSLLTDDEVADIDFLQGKDAIPLEDVWILPEFDRSRNERLAFLIKHFVDKGFM